MNRLIRDSFEWRCGGIGTVRCLPIRRGQNYMVVTRNWKLKDWLEAGSYVVVILGALAGAYIFLANLRAGAIEANRIAITRAWTNEGDVTSQETKFIDLVLENHDGDIIGTLTSPRINHPLDVHVNVGWFSSDLIIVQLHNRTVNTMAKVNLKVSGNNNRIEWDAPLDFLPEFLPRKTVLWPRPILE